MEAVEKMPVVSLTSFKLKMNFHTRLRLVAIFVLVSLLVTGLIGVYVAQKSVSALQDIFEKRTIPAVRLANILANSQRNYEVMLRLVNAAEAEKIEPAYQEYKNNKGSIEDDLKAYKEQELSDKEAALLKAFEEKKNKYEKEGLAPVFERIDAVKDSAIPRAEWSSAATLLLGKGTQEMELMINSIRELIAIQAEGAKQDYVNTKSFQTTGMVALVSVFVGSTILVIGMGFAIARSLSASLGGNPEDVRDVALRISKGDLAFALESTSRNKDSLIGAMALVREELSAIVRRIRQASSGLVNASSEISQNNLDLSARTEQQANELQHTTGGIEDLAAILQRSAESALAAVSQANDASEIARRGGEVVGEVISTMKEIQTSSNKISEIINVIDGIAFQTNILALNAAVESARAGEQGRGFAVVANEVRSLAKRSATAAKEIKTLINDSVDRVDAGTSLVDKAGTTMTQVVAAISNVSEIMQEISHSSAEQETKVSQVKDAIVQMDAMTQQNAALAEEMAAATLELNKLANDQLNAVEVFKIPDTELATPTLSLARL